MSADKIQIDRRGAVRALYLDKGSRLNALDHEMLAEIEVRFDAWERKPEVAVVIIGSTSARAFCVGADIEVLSRMDPAGMRDWEMLGNRILDRIQNSPLISIAAIPGHALGGGLTLAAACDFRICADNATFGQPEIDLGWVPGWGGVARLTRLTGVGRAKELCMTGRRIGAAEALAIGLVDRVVAAAQLPQQALEFADGLAAKSREALRGIKALAESGADLHDAAAHHFDALLNSTLLNNERAQEAIRRFLEKKRNA